MPDEVSKNQNLTIYSGFTASSFSTALGHSSSGSGGYFGGGGAGAR